MCRRYIDGLALWLLSARKNTATSSRFSRPYNVRLNGASASSNAMSSGSSPSRWLATKRLKERLTRSGMWSLSSSRWYRTKARGHHGKLQIPPQAAAVGPRFHGHVPRNWEHRSPEVTYHEAHRRAAAIVPRRKLKTTTRRAFQRSQKPDGPS